MSKNAMWARRWMDLSAQVVRDNREELIELDRQIGDGDHGENLDRGFTAIVNDGGPDESATGAEILKYMAKMLMSTVGGAAGPLYGTALLRASAKVPQTEMTGSDIVAVLEAATEGIQARGKAEAGEKTMVDAWMGASAGAKAAVAAGAGPVETWAAAAQGAETGAKLTIPMKATKGRASYLGERSVGHLDPGAWSSALLLEAAAEAARQVRDQ